MSDWRSPLLRLALLSIPLGACSRVQPTAGAPSPTTGSLPAPASGPAVVAEAEELPLSDDVRQAVTGRIAELKASGGFCETYGSVLERSLATGRIVLRPFMWRVGPALASAQAHSTGEIAVARDVDPLNVGRRSLADVLHSVEHEAAHIAFAIPSGASWNEAMVDERVAQCGGQKAEWGAGKGK